MAAVFSTRVRVEGLERLRRGLAKAGDVALRAARAELQKQTIRTLALAQSKAPLDTGLLRKNVRIQAARIIRRKSAIRGKTLPVLLRSSFTFNQRYAESQHENESFRHSQGESKFAEKAIKQRLRIIIASVASRVRRVL